LSIRIFYDDTSFRIKSWRKIVRLVNEVIAKEKRISGDLHFIITNDANLRKINIQFLEHDYDTDVITFNYNSENVVNGEVYISLDTVKRNALNYNVSLESELLRVLLHGVLHLLGYDDKTKQEQIEIRRNEDYWLEYFGR
jgi:probable rRNA maturation factor